MVPGFNIAKFLCNLVTTQGRFWGVFRGAIPKRDNNGNLGKKVGGSLIFFKERNKGEFSRSYLGGD